MLNSVRVRVLFLHRKDLGCCSEGLLSGRLKRTSTPGEKITVLLEYKLARRHAAANVSVCCGDAPPFLDIQTFPCPRIAAVYDFDSMYCSLCFGHVYHFLYIRLYFSYSEYRLVFYFSHIFLDFLTEIPSSLLLLLKHLHHQFAGCMGVLGVASEALHAFFGFSE